MNDRIGYVALGYDGPLYYVMSTARQQVGGYTAGQLMSASGCLDIAPDHGMWESNFGDRRKRIDWQKAAATVMNDCTKAGLFDPSRIRGRGIWVDAGRIVVHLGDSITVDGIPSSPLEIESDYFYQARPALLPQDSVMPADDNWSALLVREVCSRAAWIAPMHAELLAGWIAVAPICGALSVGVDLRVQGDVMPIVRACLGSLLVENAPVEREGRPLLEFRPTHLRLALPGPSGGTVDLVTAKPAPMVEVPTDLPLRLLARQIRNLRPLLTNIDTFRSVVGDSMGTLLAGAWSLYSNEVMSSETAHHYLGRYDL